MTSYSIGTKHSISFSDEEINRLVDMVNGLATVFKSLNQLVIDQGTLLDRIDYNIDQTV
jgi:syntaxin 16